MTTDDPRARFATELRATIADFLAFEHTDEGYERAAGLLGRIRGELSGPPAPHYYDRPRDADLDRAAAFREYLHQSPFGGGHNPVGPPGTVGARSDPAQPGVIGRVIAGRPYEGPAKCMHGGFVAGLFDHYLGMAQHAYNQMHGTQFHAATKEFTVRFLAPTPLDTQLIFHAWMEDVDERTLRAFGTCHASDVLTASAEGEFVKLGVDRILSTDAGGFNAPRL